MHVARLSIAFAAVALASLAAGPALAGSKSFSDPAGDSLSAPDVTSVVVSDEGTSLRFAVTLANRTTVAADNYLFIGMNVDRNRENGLFGWDYVASFTAAGHALSRANGTSLQLVAGNTSRASFVNGVLTFSLERRFIGNPAAFDFALVASHLVGGVLQAADPAPNTGMWSYAFETVRLRAGPLTRSLVATASGRTYTVRFTVADAATGKAVASASVSCRVQVGTTTLKARVKFSRGVASCTFTVPLRLVRSRVTGAIQARHRGVAASRPIAFTA